MKKRFITLIAVSMAASAMAEGLGGVQLWENGPYWAECNVGAAIVQLRG